MAGFFIRAVYNTCLNMIPYFQENSTTSDS